VSNVSRSITPTREESKGKAQSPKVDGGIDEGSTLYCRVVRFRAMLGFVKRRRLFVTQKSHSESNELRTAADIPGDPGNFDKKEFLY
jgi:hypothetical protein